MSTLETNSIGKYSGNNVSIDDALNFKVIHYNTNEMHLQAWLLEIRYTTATTGSPDFFQWFYLVTKLRIQPALVVDYLVVAGGASAAGNFD